MVLGDYWSKYSLWTTWISFLWYAALIAVTNVHNIIGAVAYSYNQFNAPQDNSYVYGFFNCYGSETNLLNCNMYSNYLRYCYSYSIAGISCRGKAQE